MKKYFDTVFNNYGGVVSGASVSVTNYPSGTVATLYSDNGVTPRANPVTTDSNGYFEFYVADGRYQITISGTGIVTRQINDVVIEDYADMTGPLTITDNSSSPALKITQTGTGNALVVEDVASDSTPFVIDQSGNVGVGATSSGARLHVIGSATVDGQANVAAKIGAGVTSDLLLGSINGNAPFIAAQGANALQFRTDSAERMRIDSNGTVHVGGAYSGGVANQDLLRVRHSNSGGAVRAQVINPNTTASSAARYDLSTGTANAYGILAVIENGAGAATAELAVGAGVLNGMFFTTSGTAPIVLRQDSNERLRIDSSGNVLVRSAAGLGYGSGAGGQVTQVTSKSTSVTLNKPCGQITTHAEALAAGARVYFSLDNSLVSGYDTLIINLSVSLGAKYTVLCKQTYTGGATIEIQNITAGSLSESLVINYTVIKGAIA